MKHNMISREELLAALRQLNPDLGAVPDGHAAAVDRIFAHANKAGGRAGTITIRAWYDDDPARSQCTSVTTSYDIHADMSTMEAALNFRRAVERGVDLGPVQLWEHVMKRPWPPASADVVYKVDSPAIDAAVREYLRTMPLGDVGS